MAPVATDLRHLIVKNDKSNVAHRTTILSMNSGTPVLEIFYVRVHPKHNQDTGVATLIYGDITVVDGGETEIIWTRPQQNPSSILSSGNILLEGPSRLLSASDPFTIELDIYVVDPARESASDSDETLSICGGIACNPYRCLDYGMVTRRFQGDGGEVSICYAVYHRALCAKITVVVLANINDSHLDEANSNESHFEEANVYGSITTHNGHEQSELFRRSKDQSVSVRQDSPIPLSRAVVAVPVTETLRVEAAVLLKDCEVADDESRHIFKGCAYFEPGIRFGASQQRFIEGKRGKMAVRVTWGC